MTRRVIGSAEALPPQAHAAFSAIGPLHEYGAEPWRPRPEVLIARTLRIDAALLDRAPHVRVVAKTGAGLDTIDLAAATERGVAVLFAPSAGTTAMAEGVIALLFATVKRMGELRVLMEGGAWERRYSVPIGDIAGSTLGIVGVGRIGGAVARLARALGMRVIAHDPSSTPVAPSDIELVPLDALFQRSDVVSLHCPLTSLTAGLVDARLLAAARPGLLLINAARGGIIASDETLLDALDHGTLAGVGLDVFATEPVPTDSRLLADPRVVCTPHAIGLTASWNAEVFATLAADVAALNAGRRPRFLANPDVFS